MQNYLKSFARHAVMFVAVAALILSSTFTTLAAAQNEQLRYATPISDNAEMAADSVLIKLKDSVRGRVPVSASLKTTGVASLDRVNERVAARQLESVLRRSSRSLDNSALAGWYEVKLGGASSQVISRRTNPKAVERLERVLVQYLSDPAIVQAEPNYVSRTTAVPNDPFYSSSGNFSGYDDLWGLKKINAANAWNYITGSSSVPVAIVDTGVDRLHEDLRNNMWVNTADPINGRDDDNNGYVDDYYGWNFAYNNNNPHDDNGHGTFVAGVAGAVGNNRVGMVGMTWTTRIMALKHSNSQGSSFSTNTVKALQYAADNGAKVSNNSYICSCISKIMEDVIDYQHDRGMVVVVAAGNDKADTLSGSPANADNAITVGATNPYDQKASFSNFGVKLDVVAPGVDIISTTPSSGSPFCGSARYCIANGTSFSSPFVAGLAALILSRAPDLNNEAVRQLIRTRAVDLGAGGKDTTFGYGRIDAANSLYGALVDKPLAPYFKNLRSRSKILPGQSSEFVYGGSPGPNFSRCTLEIGKGRTPASWKSASGACQQFASGAGVLGKIDAIQYDGGLYTVRLTATNTKGQSFTYQVYDVEIGQQGTTPPSDELPTVTITAPSNGSTVSGTVGVTATASDDKGVAKTEFYVGTRLMATDTSAPYQFSWNTNDETNGTYTLSVKAYDSIGQMAQADITVTVNNTTVVTPPPDTDTQAPAVSITSPSNYSLLSGLATFKVAASDNVAVAKVELYRDSTLLGADSIAPYEVQIDSRQLPNGYSYITAVAYDAAGNKSSATNIHYVYNR